MNSHHEEFLYVESKGMRNLKVSTIETAHTLGRLNGGNVIDRGQGKKATQRPMLL